MLYCPNLDAEFSCNPKSLGLDHHTRLLEFPDTEFNILIQEILHSLPELVLTSLLLVGKTSKTHNLS